MSFNCNSAHRNVDNETRSEFKLTEEDILKVGRLILPAANLLVAKTRRVFSGEPSMTLKVITYLLCSYPICI